MLLNKETKIQITTSVLSFRRLFSVFSEKFMRLILQGRFWFVHIPFGSIVKFQFLTQLPVNHLPHPVVSIIILLI